jgi:Zn-dependent protease with chaperone function
MMQQGATPPVTVPGPADRESFFAAQRRHRRSARWYGALTTVGVPLVGIPLSALLTPPLLMIAFVVLHITSLSLAFVSPQGLAESGRWLGETFGPVFADPGRRRIVLVVGLPILLIGPGAVAQLLLYLRVRRLFRRAGADGLLVELGAREPRPDDPEERQLVNVVAEMGIAAGLRPPRVMVVDNAPNGGAAAGAAVVGTSPDEAIIVVGRALLDQLERNATQAVIAYLVASAGNGDLQIFTTTIAARMTTHAVQYVLEARTDPRAGSVRRALILPVRQREGHRVHDLLVTLRSEPDQNSAYRPSTAPTRRSLLRLLSKPLYPLFGISFGITSPCYSICSALLWSLFMRPWQGRFLRARSAYADAAAVQLLRMADPVAEAIAAGNQHLQYPRNREELRRTREEMLRATSMKSAQDLMRAAGQRDLGVARMPVILGGGWPVDLSMFVGAEASPSGDQWIRPRPKPGRRLWRLRRLGAHVQQGVEEPRPLLTRLILRTLAAPFVAAWYVIALGLVGFFMFVAVFIGLTVFGMVYGSIIGLITVIPVLVKLVPLLWDLLRDLG